MRLRPKRLEHLCRGLREYNGHVVFGMVDEDSGKVIAGAFVHRIGTCERTKDGAFAGSAGGTRWAFYDAPNEYTSGDIMALIDGLRLSRGMSQKFAVLDVPIGGGKIVVFGHNIPGWSRTDKGRTIWPIEIQREVLQGIGEHILGPAKTLITAEDMGVDYSMVAQMAKYAPRGTVAGCAQKFDPSPVTAKGVRMCAQTAVDWYYQLGMDMRSFPIMVQGVGSVGSAIVRDYWNEGVRNLRIADTVPEAVELMTKNRPGIRVVNPALAHMTDAQILMPCAGGASLDERTVADIHYRSSTYIICGCANNQLAHPGIGQLLHDAQILWCPDYIVNGGGAAEVTAEILGRNLPEMLEHMKTSLITVLEESEESDRPTSMVSDAMVASRVAALSRPS